jgi:hypothetical protein
MRPCLLVLAAGIGSRYGGLKQLDTFGPSGEKILDYTIYDAIRIGIKKVVFVIRKEFEQDFINELSSRFEKKIEVSFVYQELDNVPQGVRIPPDREKPWGTAHAVLVGAAKINEPFIVLNADDFYGQESIKIAFDFLSSLEQEDNGHYCIVGYKLGNTLSEHGSVSRGVCDTDERGNLISIMERKRIFRKDDKIVFEDEDGSLVQLSDDVMVSMNLMGFTPSMFTHLTSYVERFIRAYSNDNKKESLLPEAVNEVVSSKIATVKILQTYAGWFGVTYREDREMVAHKINKLHNEGIFPKKLWI